jgi:hypothetical protein
MVFQAKQEMDLLEAKLDEITLLELLAEYYSEDSSVNTGEINE